MAQLQLDRQTAEALQWAKWAVGRWAAFPVDQTTRPVVLVGPRVRVERGFATTEAKMAFLDGRFKARVALPDGVLQALTDGRRDRDREGGWLQISDGELAETEFITDRGRRRLPAWRLTAGGALGPIWVLDPEVEVWQPAEGAGGPPPQLQSPGQDPGARVDVADDDRSLTLHWLGASPRFERFLTSELVESEQAFAVVPIGEDIAGPGARTLAGHVHRVPAHLHAPVKARVFVDVHGHAGQVLSAPAHQ